MAEVSTPLAKTSLRISRSPTAWVAALLALPMALPILTIVVLATGADFAAWPHLLKAVLPQLAITTLLFAAGCGALTLVMGCLSAWLIAMYRFPGRGMLRWMALLPLAIPGYITALIYVDFLTYAGPLQGWLRTLMDWQSPDDYWFPEIRSLGGAICVMSLALYPYVYMSALAAFVKQPVNQLLAARTLGRPLWRAFVSITLPQARPALAVGVVLVIMECMNDIGAVSFFGVRTVTNAIYSTWLDQGDLGGAAQLAALALLFVATLVWVEQLARNSDKLSRNAKSSEAMMLHTLDGWQAAGAAVLVFLPVFLGFLLPVILLLGHGLRRFSTGFSSGLLSAAWNSIGLALIACVGTLLVALLMGHANRQTGSRLLKTCTRFAGMGYALPGTVLGIGTLVPLSQFDLGINHLTQQVWDWRPGLILSGSLLGLALAYVTRFLIIAQGSLESGFEKIPLNLDHVARTLGRRPWQILQNIHLPLLRPALLAAALLVFVDAMKELPATLILRPFDFETLATRVFTLASLGQIEESAMAALAIVVAGLLPVIILARGLRKVVPKD